MSSLQPRIYGELYMVLSSNFAAERKKREPPMETLNEIRRRPTLPGRFQPSTISVLRLNFCVRDGNRWVPQAIVTGKERGSRLLLPRGTWYVPSLLLPPSWYRQSAVTHGLLTSLFGFRLQLLGFAPSKPHRLEFPFRLTMASGSLLHTLCSFHSLPNQFFE